MVSAFSIWKRRVMAAWLLFSALGVATAWAQGDAKPANGAEKPLPGQGVKATIEQELFGAQKVNLDLPGVQLPESERRVLVVPPPDERTREKMDAERNWVFSGMHELNSQPSLEEMLGMPELGPDGQVKPKLSAVDQYYDDLGKKGTKASNQMSDVLTMMWTVKQLTGTNEVNPMVFAIPAGEDALMKSLMMLPDLTRSSGDKDGMNDSSTPESDGQAAAATAASADRDQQRRADDFKRLLDGPSGTAGGPSTSFSGMNSEPLPQAVTAPDYGPSYSPESASFTPSSLNPVGGAFTPSASSASTTYNNPYQSGLAIPASASGNMSYDTVRSVLTQPSSPVQSPVVDPFAANFPKRKF